MKTILSLRKHAYLKTIGAFLIVVALIFGVVGCEGAGNGDGDNPPSQEGEIRTWYDLDAIRDNLGGGYLLINDLDSTTAGYTELAGPTANQGQGWQLIGIGDSPFTGTFDGQGYEIRDLFINRPDEDFVGLFGFVDEGGVIQNVGVVNADVTGENFVGGLVGINIGTVNNSYSIGNVTGNEAVGSLVGVNEGTVSSSYSAGNVTSVWCVGGMVGINWGIVSNSYSSANVTGHAAVGGLVGWNWGTVSSSYSAGNVTGDNEAVGGLVGLNLGSVSNSYSTGSVTGGEIVGGLVGWNSGTVRNSYSTGSVTGDYGVGGLQGLDVASGGPSNSFWDTETSGQATSDGGTGKNTAEMQDIDTFSGAGWNITAVDNPGTRNPSYIWNIVDDTTYPFLSWEPVS